MRMAVLPTSLILLSMPVKECATAFVDSALLLQMSNSIAHLKPFIQIRHLLRVLPFSNLDALLPLFRLDMSIFAQGEEPVYGCFECAYKWYRIEGCAYS